MQITLRVTTVSPPCATTKLQLEVKKIFRVINDKIIKQQ